MTVFRDELRLPTPRREVLVDITAEVAALVARSGVRDGLCHIFCPHTTAAITINENADPDVKRDMIWMLGQLVPNAREFAHAEGNSDAHVKSTLVGASEVVQVAGGALVLGTWQGIMFAEFDGPRSRRVGVSVQGE